MADASSTATSDRECAVCAATTTSACGGCGLPLCSRECQKLIWVAHKRVCPPASPDAFYFPPLTADEAVILRDKQDSVTLLPAGRMPLSRYLRAARLFSGKWQDLLDDLIKPAADCPIPEPRRSRILALFLGHFIDLRSPQLPPHCPWQLLGVLHCAMFEHVDPDTAAATRLDKEDPFRLCNLFHSRSLVCASLSNRILTSRLPLPKEGARALLQHSELNICERRRRV
ncbi:hypothetical protein JCM10213_007880 [Rhodosporidiobolus nylandii]